MSKHTCCDDPVVRLYADAVASSLGFPRVPEGQPGKPKRVRRRCCDYLHVRLYADTGCDFALAVFHRKNDMLMFSLRQILIFFHNLLFLRFLMSTFSNVYVL